MANSCSKPPQKLGFDWSYRVQTTGRLLRAVTDLVVRDEVLHERSVKDEPRFSTLDMRRELFDKYAQEGAGWDTELSLGFPSLAGLAAHALSIQILQ